MYEGDDRSERRKEGTAKNREKVSLRSVTCNIGVRTAQEWVQRNTASVKTLAHYRCQAIEAHIHRYIKV